MNTLRQDIMAILEQCKAEIQANMASKGINASGRTSRAFATEQDAQGLRLVLKHDEQVEVDLRPRGMHLGSIFTGVAPLQTLEIGRPGGGVPKGFYYIIKQWSREKGLSFGSESERQTFSYFTAQKIAASGTKRNTTHEQVYSEPVKKAVESISNIIGKSILNSIQSTDTNF